MENALLLTCNSTCQLEQNFTLNRNLNTDMN